MWKLIRLVLLILFIPAILAFARQAGSFALQRIPLLPANLASYGFLCYVLLYLLVLRSGKAFAQLFEHELGHLFLAKLFWRRILRFSVDAERGKGEVAYEPGSNSLITLAPYYFPVFTIPLLMAKPVLYPRFDRAFDFLIGLTLAFHYVGLLREFRLRQDDIKRVGLLFSIGVTFFLNLLFLVLSAGVILNDYLALVDYYAGALARVPETYEAVLSGLSSLPLEELAALE
jgi:hypothetical protein